MASIFTTNMQSKTVQAGKEVHTDRAGGTDKKEAAATVAIHAVDRKILLQGGVTD